MNFWKIMKKIKNNKKKNLNNSKFITYQYPQIKMLNL